MSVSGKLLTYKSIRDSIVYWDIKLEDLKSNIIIWNILKYYTSSNVGRVFKVSLDDKHYFEFLIVETLNVLIPTRDLNAGDSCSVFMFVDNCNISSILHEGQYTTSTLKDYLAKFSFDMFCKMRLV